MALTEKLMLRNIRSDHHDIRHNHHSTRAFDTSAEPTANELEAPVVALEGLPATATPCRLVLLFQSWKLNRHSGGQIVRKFAIFHVNNAIGNIKNPVIVRHHQDCAALLFCQLLH